MTEELQTVGKLYTGSAYSVEIENLGIPKNATIADIIRFEKNELGNDYGISDEEMKILDKYNRRDAVWVTKKKSEAKEYLSHGMTSRDISKVDLPPGSRIVADDGMGGYLVLRGDAKPVSKGGELSPEFIDEAGILPIHAGKGWEMDRGAIPGEVCAYYKNRIGIREIENEQDQVIYEVVDLIDGKPLGRFSGMPKAAEFGGEYYAKLDDKEWRYGEVFPGDPLGYYCPVEAKGFEGAMASLYETEDGKYYIKMQDGTLVYNPENKSALFDDIESAKERFKMYTGDVKPGDYVVVQGVKDTYEGVVISVQDDTIRMRTPQWARMQWNKSSIKEITPRITRDEYVPPPKSKSKRTKASGSPAAGYLE